MITGVVRETRDGYVVEVSREEVQRLDLHDGQEVSVEIRARGQGRDPVQLADDLREAFDIEFRKGAAGLRYLAEH
jgi:hypothetical protein